MLKSNHHPPRPGRARKSRAGDSESLHGAAYGCQTARQYLWGGLAVTELVTLSVPDVSVFVETETQLVKLLELWIT